MAEELGFEPRRRFPDLPVFKTGPFSHLGTPPFGAGWWIWTTVSRRKRVYSPPRLATSPSQHFWWKRRDLNSHDLHHQFLRLTRLPNYATLPFGGKDGTWTHKTCVERFWVVCVYRFHHIPIGQDNRIWTYNHLIPNQVLYQVKLYPDTKWWERWDLNP